ncbi:hypothetical protein CL615_04615 [archaeon]|jgi:geranylgeranyl diphosphate synthase type I|nr:hypothetical protein [archaeon]MDP6548079.1 polyprenyl synthetase family protein [Candidatus Woesearchaeota archaeon]|tara:strand:- start:2183 stop:3265 length:1083 start_codon:yes stop_codon:yes gene_type:complete
MNFNNTLKKYNIIVDKELNKLFEDEIKKTKDEFLKACYSYLKEFTLRPGKRMRPIAAIMAYKSINDSDEEKIYPLAITPELFHASSLIHDDIMDEDSLRRNKPAMHKLFESYFKKNFTDKKYKGPLFDSFSKRFSVSMAIIQGNILYSLSNYCVIKSKLDGNLKNKSLKIFNDAYQKINEGQSFDLMLSFRKELSEEDYIAAAMNKTASLLSASIMFGAVLNNAKPYQLENLEKYANSIALAFQLHDDIMDLSEKMNKGRVHGTDLRKGNSTLIIIKALQNSNESQKKFLSKVLGNNKATESEIKGCISVIKDTGALDYVQKYANKKIMEAKKYLNKSDLNEQGYKFFNDFADYIVMRSD